MEFRLPELGEGIADATVTNIAVKVGQKVTSGETLIEVETDKANMPIDAPSAMTISEIKVQKGQKVKVGATILTYSGSDASPAPNAPANQPASSVPPTPLPPRNQPHTSAPPLPAAPVPQSSSPLTVSQSSAPQKVTVKLPELGEGIESGTITAIAVKVGDVVKTGQELFTVETDKAAMPVESTADGTIESLVVKVGDKVKIGATLATLAGSSMVSPTSAPTSSRTEGSMKTGGSTGSTSLGSPPVVETKTITEKVGNAPSTSVGVINTSGPVPASPATRRYAREHNVSLHEVLATGRGGRVTPDDVKAHIRKRMAEPVGTPAAPSTNGLNVVGVTSPLPDFSKYGPVEKRPLSNLRKKIAENLSIAWNTAPAVTQHDLADITELEAGRKRIVENLPKGAPKITMTVLAVKAIVAALKEFPLFNSSLDMVSGEVVVKQYYNIGIAVDTEKGLVVPVIREADKKSIRDIATEITTLAEKARAGKLTIDEMRGGSFTLTNLGGIGGTAFSPIINYPEVAILGLSKSSIQPVYRDNQFVPRLMMPLSLTYDHRIIDGADGARFTNRLVQLFSDPIRLLMES
ncbi:MAG: 2-oxo acid dehydrogenase subunit E2 [Gemmataceae bacterium]|nr:2-oxo acid dehydrogenase subunit E2 [Gemmataceae bacterium]